MRQKTIAFGLLGLCLLLLAAAVGTGVWYFGGAAGEAPAAAQESPAGQPAEDPVAEAEEPSVPAQRVKPERDSAVLSPQPVAAGADYFADAAFLVNSVSQGLDMYDYDGLLTQADFYGTANLAAPDAMDYIRQMQDGDYGKIYIGLGINELWRDTDVLRSCYAQMLEELMSYRTDSIIVLMGVPPVSAYKSSTNANYTRELVAAYNTMLLDLAEEWGVWYLDTGSVLADEEGYLPSEVTEDGIHFTPAWYQRWFALLAENFVNDGTVKTEPLPAEAAAGAEEGGTT